MTFRIPLHHCRLQPNIPAGLNYLRVGAIADRIRNGGLDIEPVLVRYRGPRDWLILDGRHRWMASWVAGVRDIAAIKEVS